MRTLLWFLHRAGALPHALGLDKPPFFAIMVVEGYALGYTSCPCRGADGARFFM